VADIKAVQNSMSLGAAPQQQPQQQPVTAEPVKEEVAAVPQWDGIERRRSDSDRRADSEKRPDFLETRHRNDRRRRRSVSVKV